MLPHLNESSCVRVELTIQKHSEIIHVEGCIYQSGVFS